ncbi:beta-propeller domain-containing protein, partial [Nocardioides sp.]|uniref:beta-propeller domain-containing protein n=1 Tax=Nocardioides sp. TaxID=35761 RepID=UPI00356AF566
MSSPAPLRRSIQLLGITAALTGAFVAGSVWTGGSDPAPRGAGSATGAPLALVGSGLSAPESCDELLDWYVRRGLSRVGPYGWDQGYYGGPVVMEDGMVRGPVPGAGPVDTGSADTSATAPSAAKVPTTIRVTNDPNGTNVQEQGVDEPDVVKSDGRTLFRVDGGDLVTYDVRGDEVERLGSADLVDLREGEILLSGDTLVAIGENPTMSRPSYEGYPTTRVMVLDVTDPARPAVEHTYDISASTVEARLHGDVVRLVTRTGLPNLPFTQNHRDERSAELENREVVRVTTIEDWLPTISTDEGDPETLVECATVALPSNGDSLGTMTVVGFDVDDPDARSVTGLAADTELAYLSADRLYLATSAFTFGGCWEVCMQQPSSRLPSWWPGRSERPGRDGVSQIYAFELDGEATRFTADGEVDGSIRDRWAMDEADDVLRVAVGATSATGQFNSIITLTEDGNDLVELGRLDKLGVGEDIKSMRWFDDLAIMVTFRQVDPLYAIDLTELDRPRLLGELKIPGFSAYLHPLGERRLLGLGEGPSQGRGGWGAQAGLFNVTDLTDPKRLDLVSYGAGTSALATADPRQLTWLPAQRTILTVIADWNRGGQVASVSVLKLNDAELSNRMVEVEYGDDIYDVRL